MCCLSHRHILLRALEDEGEREVVEALTREVQKTTRQAWDRQTRLAINVALRSLGARVGLTQALANMDKILTERLSKIFTRAEARRISAAVEGMYTAFKRVSVKDLGIAFSFRQVDRGAVAALAKEQPFWIGEFYTRQLSERIRDVSQKAIIEQGLGRREAGRLMADVLKKDLAWAGGPATVKGVDVIPARFAGNVQGYSEIVVANAANRGRNMGFLSSFADAGIERFRWNSVMDKRTSQICQYMDGREFAVETGIAHMEAINAAETPEDVKAIAPWQSIDQLQKTGGRGTTAEQNTRLAAAGIMVPPAHGRCRSVVEAV